MPSPEVIAVQFDQVEDVEEYAVVSAVVTDKIKRGHAVVTAGHSFVIDDARARAQSRQRIDDQRKNSVSSDARAENLPR